MDERRRYFRINDTFGLSYKLIKREAETIQLPAQPLCVAGLKSALSAQEQRFQQLLTSLQKKDLHVAEALSVINKKINLISRHLEAEKNRDAEMEYELRHVNISACGVAFITHENLALDTFLMMDLLLTGELTPLRLNGAVVGCQANGQKFYVRVDFEDMSVADEETLIHYMLKRQGEQMRDMLSRKPHHGTASPSVN